MTTEYTLTLTDVQAYLDTKQDTDVIGETCHPLECLLAETLRMKYPGIGIKVGIEYMYFYAPLDTAKVEMSAELKVIRRLFDEMGQMKEITKRQWLKAQGIAA